MSRPTPEVGLVLIRTGSAFRPSIFEIRADVKRPSSCLQTIQLIHLVDVWRTTLESWATRQRHAGAHMPHCTATAHNLAPSHAVNGSGPAPVQLQIPRHKCGHPAIDNMNWRRFPGGKRVAAVPCHTTRAPVAIACICGAERLIQSLGKFGCSTRVFMSSTRRRGRADWSLG